MDNKTMKKQLEEANRQLKASKQANNALYDTLLLREESLNEANAKLAAIQAVLESTNYGNGAVEKIASIVEPPPAAPEQTYMQLPPGRKR